MGSILGLVLFILYEICKAMEQYALKNVNNCLSINIYSYLERHLVVKVLIYILMLFIFSTSVFIRHLWQLKTVVFMHWCLLCAGALVYKIYLSIDFSFTANVLPSIYRTLNQWLEVELKVLFKVPCLSDEWHLVE